MLDGSKRLFKLSLQHAWVVSICLTMFTIISCQHTSHVPLAQSDNNIVFECWGQRRYPDAPLCQLSLRSGQQTFIQNSEHALIGPLTQAPDGKTIAFTDIIPMTDENGHGYTTRSIILLNSDGNRTIFCYDCMSPSWSSDGLSLAFVDLTQSTLSLKTALIDGTNELEIVDKITKSDIRITWSPDSHYLAYENQNLSGEWAIWIVESGGGVPSQLTTGRYPAWSPVADIIAFVRDGDIWIISTKDKTEHLLIDDPVGASWPAWAPDGQQLVFVSSRDGNWEIYRSDYSGMNVERLTNNPDWDDFPTWGP